MPAIAYFFAVVRTILKIRFCLVTVNHKLPCFRLLHPSIIGITIINVGLPTGDDKNQDPALNLVFSVMYLGIRLLYQR